MRRTRTALGCFFLNFLRKCGDFRCFKRTNRRTSDKEELGFGKLDDLNMINLRKRISEAKKDEVSVLMNLIITQDRDHP